MEIFALFMLCVMGTLFIPETKRRSLEELSKMYHDEMEDTENIARS